VIRTQPGLARRANRLTVAAQAKDQVIDAAMKPPR
jgi:hypothetical protein